VDGDAYTDPYGFLLESQIRPPDARAVVLAAYFAILYVAFRWGGDSAGLRIAD
jgi:hypothetical protein